MALYLAQQSGRRCMTLFCDEADGALDADRKRMFMAMKREVLKLGGYEREYFVIGIHGQLVLLQKLARGR